MQVSAGFGAELASRGRALAARHTPAAVSAILALLLIAPIGLLALDVAAPPVQPPSQPANVAGPAALLDPVGWAALPTPSPTASPSPTPTPTLTPSPSPSPSPTPKPTAKPKPKPIIFPDTVLGARHYVIYRVGQRQYNCINYVWTRESKWNPRAGTPSGAYGIPQAFPGSKMAAFGKNWLTSPLTQVKWGLWYVNDRYGSACAAYSFFVANGWY